MTKSTFVNLTPHTLNVHCADGVVNIAPSGEVARCKVTYTPDGFVGEFPVFVATYGDVTGLPAPSEGLFFIVSGMVTSHPSVSGRPDVFSPGELVRDETGRPCGCKGLKRAKLRGKGRSAYAAHRVMNLWG